MSQIREAMLEVLCIITGLTKEEVEQKSPLRKLLDRADSVKGKPKRYCFGIFTFCYPRKNKDGSCLPFLGVRVDIGRVEDLGVAYLPTYESLPTDLDIELNFGDEFAEKFVAKMAKQRAREEEKQAAKARKINDAPRQSSIRRMGRRPFSIAPAGALISAATG